ncbi:hypothetical protein ACIBI3_21810 [Actinomadura luteofluorescens]|uniref:hypothetical protein n=1 Tax=Actinomadura luteofluorescens TaxID=46163 RepID=UPI0034865391
MASLDVSGTHIAGGISSNDEVETLGVAQPEAATHRLLAHEGKVYGVQDGAVLVFDPAAKALDYVNLVQRGFKGRAGAADRASVTSLSSRAAGAGAVAAAGDLAPFQAQAGAVAGESWCWAQTVRRSVRTGSGGCSS